MLIIHEYDSLELALFKKVFKELCIIFIKNYSVNWIFSGKIGHKDVHLHARAKMLRRIKHPEFFTPLSK